VGGCLTPYHLDYALASQLRLLSYPLSIEFGCFEYRLELFTLGSIDFDYYNTAFHYHPFSYQPRFSVTAQRLGLHWMDSFTSESV
jgi:hypothetical protein